MQSKQTLDQRHERTDIRARTGRQPSPGPVRPRSVETQWLGLQRTIGNRSTTGVVAMNASHADLRRAPVAAVVPGRHQVIQRQVRLDLPIGTEVVDGLGNPGIIVGVEAGRPGYVVQFAVGKPRWVHHLDLFPASTNAGHASDFDEDASGFVNQNADQDSFRRRVAAAVETRPGKSVADGDPGPKKSAAAVVRGFGKRTGKALRGPELPTSTRRTYSDRGGLGAVHERAGQTVAAVVDHPLAAPVEKLITAPTEAAVGTNRRGGRTPGSVALGERRLGQALRVAADVLQMVPVIGAAAGALTGPAEFLDQHSRGASKKQAFFKALAATASGAAAGAIPGYGTYAGARGLVSDFNQLVSKSGTHGDPQYAHLLLERFAQLVELIEEIDNRGDLTEAEQEKLARELERTAEKFRSRYVKEMRRREKQERGRYGAKTGLLDESKWGELE